MTNGYQPKPVKIGVFELSNGTVYQTEPIDQDTLNHIRSSMKKGIMIELENRLINPAHVIQFIVKEMTELHLFTPPRGTEEINLQGRGTTTVRPREQERDDNPFGTRTEGLPEFKSKSSKYF